MYTNKQINPVLIYDALKIIIQKLNLNLDQLGELDVLVRQYLRGDVSSQDFYKELKKRLEIGDDVAIKLVPILNEQVFGRINRFVRDENQIQDSEEIYTEPAHEILAHIEDPNKEVAQRVVTPFSIPITAPDPTPVVTETNVPDTDTEPVSNKNLENLPEIEPEHRITIKINQSDTIQNDPKPKEVGEDSKPDNPYSIADTKLKETISNPITKYTVDPYREPPIP